MRRLQRVILENFQSHTYTELPIAPTLTVITGESDQGKSAIVRALRWLFYNEPRGADFIKTGAAGCRVTVVYDDGTHITRERTASGSRNRYVICRPGEEDLIFEKVGNDVPGPVMEITGVKKLALDDTQALSLHLAQQLDPPFLLSSPGPVKAKAIGSLARTEVFDTAQHRAALDARRIEDRTRRLEEEIAAIDRQLEGFGDIAVMEQALERLGRVIARITGAQERLNILHSLRARWQATRARLQLVEQELAVLTMTGRAEAVLTRSEERVARLAALLTLAACIEQARTRLRAVDDVLARTERMPLAEEKVARLEALGRKLGRLVEASLRLAGIRERLGAADRVLRVTAGIPQATVIIGDAEVKNGQHGRLVTFADRLHRASAALAAVARVLAMTEQVTTAAAIFERAEGIPHRLQNLRRLQGQWRNRTSRLEATEQRREEACRQLQALGRAYREVLARAGRCPVCASPIDGEAAVRIAATEAELG